jgi:hypothetical protein
MSRVFEGARVISSSGRKVCAISQFVVDRFGVKSDIKSPALPRPPSPRFADFPTTPLPPLPFRDSRVSPGLRSVSPRSSASPSQLLPFSPSVITRGRSRSRDTQRPSPPLVIPVPRYDSHPYSRQPDPLHSSRASASQYRPVTPRDDRYEPHDLTEQITRGDKCLSAFGGYGDICTGSWEYGTRTYKVRISEMDRFYRFM